MAYDSHPEIRPLRVDEPGHNIPIEFTPRFDHILEYLEAKGGTYQRSRKDLIAELDVTDYVLRRVLERSKELGLLKIIASSHPMIGQGGRFPSTYVMLTSVAHWKEHREEIVTAHREQRRRKKAAEVQRNYRARRKGEAAVVADAISARDRAQARRENEAPAIPFASPANLASIPFDDDLAFDVDAWANAVDFDDF